MPVVETVPARTEDEAVTAAERIGYPVACAESRSNDAVDFKPGDQPLRVTRGQHLDFDTESPLHLDVAVKVAQIFLV